MKKFNKAIALFLSLLMIFSVFNVVVFAEGDDTTIEETTVEEPTEEETTKNVIVVDSWFGLKVALFIKLIEKIFLFIEKTLDKLFGKEPAEEPTSEVPTEEPTEEPTSEELTEEPTEEETTEEELPSAA